MTRANRADGADGVFTGADGVFIRVDGLFTGPNGVMVQPDGVFIGPDEVFIRPNKVMARPDGVEIRGIHNISAEEQSKLLVDVAAYQARISFLESKLIEVGFTKDASNNNFVVWAEEFFEDRGVEQP